MENMPTISLLNDKNAVDFKQLEQMLERFMIDTYIRNKPQYATIRGQKRIEIINQALNEFHNGSNLTILTTEEVNKIRKEIEAQIDYAKETITQKPRTDCETRYYLLKDENTLIGFQQAQVSQKQNGVVGWRNLAYIDPKYAGKGGIVKGIDGTTQETIYSEALYKEISKWFSENNVAYEKTCTGINMLPNILAYIRNKGFIPCGRSKNNIFLEKDLGQNIDKKTLGAIYKMLCNNKERKEPKTAEKILMEINEVEEFNVLTKEQKGKMASSFLKDDELKQPGLSEGLAYIQKLFASNAERFRRAFNIEEREFPSKTKSSIGTKEKSKEIKPSTNAKEDPDEVDK